MWEYHCAPGAFHCPRHQRGRKEPLFLKSNSVLIIWETRIYLLLAPFTLKMSDKPEQAPQHSCQ